MNKIILYIVILLVVAGCGPSYEEHVRITKAQRAQELKEDSAALKVAVIPTIDCLPLFVAKEKRLFDTLGVDIRLKQFAAQMDCDTAMARGRVEGSVTDLFRAERLQKEGTPLRYVAATDIYWQFITNRTARAKELKQMEDKMIAMTRYSATDYLAHRAMDSVKLGELKVFYIQVNDVNLRLNMLINNEMDAVLLPEPQATKALQAKNVKIFDSRDMDVRPGVIAFRERPLKDKNRQKQLEAFLKAYNAACDSVNKYGVKNYAGILEKYCKTDKKTVEALPKNIRFQKAQAPRQKDIDLAKKQIK